MPTHGLARFGARPPAGTVITMTSHERHVLSNHPQLYCLYNRLFRLTSKQTSKPALLALCEASDCPNTNNANITHTGLVTHICVGKLIIIGSDNGLSPGRRQAIIWTNAGILLIGPLGTNFSEILIEIDTFSFKKMHLKISSAKWRPFCLGLNVLTKQIKNKIVYNFGTYAVCADVEFVVNDILQQFIRFWNEI